MAPHTDEAQRCSRRTFRALDNGARYVPNGGSQEVQMLRKNVNAFHEAIRLWSSASDEPEGSTEGYDRIVDQAGIEYTWGVVLDRPKPAVGIRRSHPDGVNAIPCAALDEHRQRSR